MHINRRDHLKTIIASTFQLTRWTTPTLTAVVLPVHAQTSCETIESIRVISFENFELRNLDLDFEFTGDGCNTSIASPSNSSPDIKISFDPNPGHPPIVGLVPFIIYFENLALQVSVTERINGSLVPRITNLGTYTSQSGNMFNVISALTIDGLSTETYFTAKITLESK